MIRITCTSCKSVLTIDDAFAGGVCRCKHCGTIQTVPASMKGSAERTPVAAGAGSAAGSSSSTGKSAKPSKAPKALYQGATGSGSGIEELASVVSSGLSDPLLRRPNSAALAASARAKKNRTVLALAGGIIALLFIIIILLLNRGPKTPSPASPGNGTPASDSPDNPARPGITGPRITGPAFATLALTGDCVVYVIDNGNSAQADLDAFKEATYRSIRSLGAKTKFEIAFWNPDSTVFPLDDHPVAANDANIEKAIRDLGDVTAFGATESASSFARALKAKPATIVLITAKTGDDFDQKWLDAMMALRGNSPVKVDVVRVAESQDSGMLPKLAAATGGRFVILTASDLRAAAAD